MSIFTTNDWRGIYTETPISLLARRLASTLRHILLHVCTGREHRTHHHFANTTWRYRHHNYHHRYHSRRRLQPIIGFSHIIFFLIILFIYIYRSRSLYRDVSFIEIAAPSDSVIVSRLYIRTRGCPKFIMDLSVQDRAESDEFDGNGRDGRGGGSGGDGDCEQRRSRMH